MSDKREARSDESRNSRSQFTVAWDAVRLKVFAQILAGVGSYHDAEDVLQDVAISLAESYEKYDPTKPFIAWALGFARHHILRYYRDNAGKGMVLDEATLSIIGEEFIKTHAEAYTSMRSDALFQCLEALESERRDVIALRYADDLSVTEISLRMKKTTAAVKSLLHRARIQLKECVERRLAIQSSHQATK